MQYTLEYAKRDFSAGYIDTFAIDRTLTADAFVYVVLLGSGSAQGPLVDARDKKPRHFKSIDAAVSALGSIGFRVERLVPNSAF